MAASAQLLPGTLDLLVLKAVSLGPLHGYGILLRIGQISQGALLVEQGALYPALFRLVEVVGLAQDGKYTANLAEQSRAAMFFPLRQVPSSETWLVIRSPRDAEELSAAVRATLHALDPGLPASIETWTRDMGAALFPARAAAAALGILGAMGAIVAITGIFGTAAYSLSKHLEDLGIRLALGAGWLDIIQATVGRALRLLAVGSLAGLALGILASRVLGSIVYEATPRDPVVLIAAVFAMFLVGLVATWIPARRALSVDPAMLMREP